ncbi:hypothetical protein CDIK_1081 [Cucumispora dikerogammari]|nr:hypothetical protein CDIK_1081 [Cucumispora dikerogammari]
MLVLIFNLLFISYCCDCETKEMFDLRIIHCGRGIQRGELLDTNFLNNKCSYSIGLFYVEPFWKINISLHVGFVENTYTGEGIRQAVLAKCKENIVLDGYNENFKLDSSIGCLFQCERVSFRRNENCFIAKYEIKEIEWVKDGANYEKLFKKARINKEKTAEILKSTKMNNFRKSLGISGAGIETSQFKFRFDLFARGENFVDCKKTTFETEQFGFGLNKDGTLVLNKPIKRKRCVKSLG